MTLTLGSEPRTDGRRGQLFHFGLHQLGCAPLRLCYCEENQVGKQLGITTVERLGVDAHVTNVPAPIGRHAHKTTAGLDLEGPVGKFGLKFLEATLPLLAELPHLLKVNHSHFTATGQSK
jgi:hypothetical protein